MLNLAVVGHVEWVTHTEAPFIPPAGEIVHLTDPLTEPAGGGAVTSAALAPMGRRRPLLPRRRCGRAARRVDGGAWCARGRRPPGRAAHPCAGHARPDGRAN